MRKKIINYFSKISSIYDKKSNSFPWKYIRYHESKIFKKMIFKKKYYRGLDLGSGSGFYTTILKKYCKKLIAVDYTLNMLKNIKDDKIIKINGDANKIRLNQKFDVIICLGIFEFNKNYKKIYQTVKVHSKKQTNIILMMPYKNLFSSFYYLFHRFHGVSLNILTKKKLTNDLKKYFIVYKKSYIFPFSMIVQCKIKL